MGTGMGTSTHVTIGLSHAESPPREVCMPRPLQATPILYGADARRVQDELQGKTPVDPARKAATRLAIRAALRRFKMVATLPTARPTTPPPPSTGPASP